MAVTEALRLLIDADTRGDVATPDRGNRCAFPTLSRITGLELVVSGPAAATRRRAVRFRCPRVGTARFPVGST